MCTAPPTNPATSPHTNGFTENLRARNSSDKMDRSGLSKPAADHTSMTSLATMAAVATKWLSFPDGVIQPSVSRGRSSTTSAMASRRASVTLPKSRLRGRNSMPISSSTLPLPPEGAIAMACPGDGVRFGEDVVFGYLSDVSGVAVQAAALSLSAWRLLCLRTLVRRHRRPSLQGSDPTGDRGRHACRHARPTGVAKLTSRDDRGTGVPKGAGSTVHLADTFIAQRRTARPAASRPGVGAPGRNHGLDWDAPFRTRGASPGLTSNRPPAVLGSRR